MQNNFNNITVGGVTYKLGDAEKPPCSNFWIDPNGHTNFWCPVTAGVSGTSTNPRCEYRETEESTNVSFNWFPADFSHNQMDGIVRIEKYPSSGKVIFAQIHAHLAPWPFVKLFFLSGELKAEVRFRPNDSGSPTVIRAPYIDKIAYSIEASSNGQLGITLNGFYFECPIDVDWQQHPFYFKAGSYVIDNIGDSSEGGWVVYENLSVYHGE